MDEPGGAMLIVQGGANSGKTIPLMGRAITVGRRRDNDVMIDETVVSRRHALIMETGEGYILRDLNSTNGTYVNQERLGAGDHPLEHGDQIRLASSDVTLVFRDEGSSTVKISLNRTEEATAGFLTIDGQSRAVYVRGTKLDPPLSTKQFDLLRFLDSRRGAVVSRAEVAINVWPELPNGELANREIDDAVSDLRARIEDDVDSPVHLVAIGEFGYKLD